jgi:succinyl-CoA synthetase beta subunit
MKIHEYQAKELLRLYEVPTPIGSLVASALEAQRVTKDLGGRVVVKAQVHAGGRGLGGGVKIASSPDEAAELYERIHGMTLVTKQTGPAGKTVRRVYIEEATAVSREFYLALTIDRKSGRVVLLASSLGGSAVEDAARHNNEAFGRVEIDSAIGPAAFALRAIAGKLGLGGRTASDFIDIARRSYRLFIENDCELLEINPLAQTSEGRLVAL